MLVNDIDILNDITDDTPNAFVVNSNVEIDYIKYNLSNTRYEAVSI